MFYKESKNRGSQEVQKLRVSMSIQGEYTGRVSGGTTFKIAPLDTNHGDTLVTLTVRLVCRCIQKGSGCVTEMRENFDKYSFILRKKINVPKVFLLSVEREAQFP